MQKVPGSDSQSLSTALRIYMLNSMRRLMQSTLGIQAVCGLAGMPDWPLTMRLFCAAGLETRACTSLLRHGLLCSADGPLLCMGPELRRVAELQGAARHRLLLDPACDNRAFLAEQTMKMQNGRSVQAFLLFIFYTMLASATATGLILEKFIDLLYSGQMEDTVRCAFARSCCSLVFHDLPHGVRLVAHEWTSGCSAGRSSCSSHSSWTWPSPLACAARVPAHLTCTSSMHCLLPGLLSIVWHPVHSALLAGSVS